MKRHTQKVKKKQDEIVDFEDLVLAIGVNI